MNIRIILILSLASGALFGVGCQKTVAPAPTSENNSPMTTTMQTPTIVVATATHIVATTTKKPEPAVKPATVSPQIPKGPITIYVGTGCPHCARVELRAAETGMDKKIPIVFKEVFNDQANAAEFLGVAKTCGLDINNLGVPVMWDGATCTEGEPDIIKFIDLTMQAYAKLKK